MASRVTALAWRPQTFDDVIGQDVITKTLQNAIQSDRIHHAYLFAGLRGSGKTSTARILAKALNCEKGPTAEPCLACHSCQEIREGTSLDVVEIDAASNNSVDNIRELREWVRYSSARDSYKIYIIDEVHMLSASAFNALLKTLEEPPPNVVFILATTELHKIPATILSRTQQFDFRQIPLHKIEQRLKAIADADQIDIEQEAIALIAQSAGGSMRDALSVFDQVISASGDGITRLDVQSVLGVVEDANLVDLLWGIVNGSAEQLFARVAELVHYGHDLKQAYDAFTTFVRDCIVLKSVDNPSDLILRTYGHQSSLDEVLSKLETADLIRMFDQLVALEPLFRASSQPRYGFELVMLKLMELRRLKPIEELIQSLGDRRGDPGSKKKTLTLGDVVAHIRAMGKPALAATVSNAFRLKSTPDRVTFSFDPSHENLAAMIEVAPHRDDLLQLMRDLAGTDVTVAVALETDPNIQAAKKDEQQALEYVKNDPKVKVALDIFKGSIVKLQPVDEKKGDTT